jgi:hypothetical protein
MGATGSIKADQSNGAAVAFERGRQRRRAGSTPVVDSAGPSVQCPVRSTGSAISLDLEGRRADDPSGRRDAPLDFYRTSVCVRSSEKSAASGASDEGRARRPCLDQRP